MVALALEAMAALPLLAAMVVPPMLAPTAVLPVPDTGPDMATPALLRRPSPRHQSLPHRRRRPRRLPARTSRVWWLRRRALLACSRRTTGPAPAAATSTGRAAASATCAAPTSPVGADRKGQVCGRNAVSAAPDHSATRPTAAAYFHTCPMLPPMLPPMRPHLAVSGTPLRLHWSCTITSDTCCRAPAAALLQAPWICGVRARAAASRSWTSRRWRRRAGAARSTRRRTCEPGGGEQGCGGRVERSGLR